MEEESKEEGESTPLNNEEEKTTGELFGSKSSVRPVFTEVLVVVGAVVAVMIFTPFFFSTFGGIFNLLLWAPLTGLLIGIPVTIILLGKKRMDAMAVQKDALEDVMQKRKEIKSADKTKE